MGNGNWRASPFDGTRRQVSNESSSRAVEYSIDEEKMEVSELWEYVGKTDERICSVAMGNATILPSTGNVLITFGSVIYTDGMISAASGQGASHARIVEVDNNHDSDRVYSFPTQESN